MVVDVLKITIPTHEWSEIDGNLLTLTLGMNDL